MNLQKCIRYAVCLVIAKILYLLIITGKLN